MLEVPRLVSAVVLASSVMLLGCGGDDGGGGGGGNGDAPVADFTMTPSCTDSSMTDVTFTSTSMDTEDGTSLTCSWTFSSCTAPASCTSTQCTVNNVRFPSVSPYPVTLVVTDSDGNTDSLQQTIMPCN